MNRKTLSWNLQFVLISLYGFIGYNSYSFQRPGIWALPVCIVFSLFLEFMYSKYLQKIPSAVSGMILGSACFLQLSSLNIFSFILVISFAFAVKTISRVDSHHIFNPANIGILCFLSLFPNMASNDVLQWTFAHDSKEFYFILLFGTITTVLANSFFVPVGYVLLFVASSFLRSSITNVDYTFFLMPILNPATLIFLFHMISDPVTTPKLKRHQLLFGGATALIDQFLRHNSVFYGPLIALALVSCVRGLKLSLKDFNRFQSGL